MKLSTRSRYGLRAMLVIAEDNSGRAVMTREIAEKQQLPVTYLEQLMLSLRKASLVRATRGAKGGYVLARAAEDISLIEIVEALEGPLNIGDCADIASCCMDRRACALRCIFEQANDALVSVFRTISLADLVVRQEALDRQDAVMFYI